MLDYPSILIISLYYQYVNVDWYPMQLLGLIFSAVCLTYCMIMMPESPKYLYMNGNFEEARLIINNISKLNGNTNQTNFKFDTEVISRDTEEDSEPLVA
jgi:hypothetical protein